MWQGTAPVSHFQCDTGAVPCHILPIREDPATANAMTGSPERRFV